MGGYTFQRVIFMVYVSKEALKYSISEEKHLTACFPLHFSRALAASWIKAECIKTEQSTFKVSLVVSKTHPCRGAYSSLSVESFIHSCISALFITL